MGFTVCKTSRLVTGLISFVNVKVNVFFLLSQLSPSSFVLFGRSQSFKVSSLLCHFLNSNFPRLKISTASSLNLVCRDPLG